MSVYSVVRLSSYRFRKNSELFSKNYLIFLDLRVIVHFGSIKVEQRVDESPLFLVGFQQERVTSGGCALARKEDVAEATALGTRVS